MLGVASIIVGFLIVIVGVLLTFHSIDLKSTQVALNGIITDSVKKRLLVTTLILQTILALSNVLLSLDRLR